MLLSGVRWNFLWQRHQILATYFARAGYRTVFVETTGLTNPRLDSDFLWNVLQRVSTRSSRPKLSDMPENLSVYAPLTLPPTSRIFDGINCWALIPKVVRDLKSMIGAESPIIVVYPPTRTSLRLIEALSPRLVLYDCSEEYAGMTGTPRDLPTTERELLRRSDIVSCTSNHLLKRIRSFRPDAFLSGPGVEAERFEIQRESGARKKVVCYFGHLGEERVRLDVLWRISESGFTLRIVGEVRGRAAWALIRLPGVDYRGTVSHERLPEALDGVDAFVLPYSENALTRGISPAKIYECLATGRPTIATPIPSMRELDDYIYLAREPQEYLSVLGNLDESESPYISEKRRELARKHSWEIRFREIEAALTHRLDRM